jgi:hypothetical protein
MKLILQAGHPGDMQGVIAPGYLDAGNVLNWNTHVCPGIPSDPEIPRFSAYLGLGNSWYSYTGAFRLTLQALDGNLVLQSLFLDRNVYGNITLANDPTINPNSLLGSSKWLPIWNAGIQGKGAKEVDMQQDGNLVAYTGSAPGSPSVWNSATEHHMNAVLVVQDDGNLVIYDTLGTPLWSTQTNVPHG